MGGASLSGKYETDFYAWATAQARLLREGRFDEADIPNIAEELDSFGRHEKRELNDRLATLLTELVKWQVQPGHRGRQWQLTLREQRSRLADHLNENPSLPPMLPDAITTAYRRAILAAQRETGFAETTFPPACPWTPDQVLSDGFLPDI